jgi:hypothetical protein
LYTLLPCTWTHFWIDRLYKVNGNRYLVTRMCGSRDAVRATSFPRFFGVDQPVEIINVLSKFTKEEIRGMNSNYKEFKFPQIKGCQWKKIFPYKTPEDAMNFIAATLTYLPASRLKLLDGCTHPFLISFGENRLGYLMVEVLYLFFSFTEHELSQTPALIDKLIPPHIAKPKAAPEESIDDDEKVARAPRTII